MKKNMLKKMGMGIATTMVAGSMLFAQSGVSEAALVSKKVETSPTVKILNNNVLVSGNIGPIIMDGTTYLPVRSLAGVLNKTVRWDGPNKSIYITDNVSSIELSLRKQLQERDSMISQFRKDITTKDSQIANLESAAKTKDAKITELENAIKTKDAKIAELEKKIKSNSEDIGDLEDDLNDDYEDWNDLDLSITLSGDEDDIKVKIKIDVEEHEDDYDYLDEDDFEDLVNDIADDIWKEFKDADISGSIVDSSDRNKELYEFSGSNGKIKKFEES